MGGYYEIECLRDFFGESSVRALSVRGWNLGSAPAVIKPSYHLARQNGSRAEKIGLVAEQILEEIHNIIREWGNCPNDGYGTVRRYTLGKLVGMHTPTFGDPSKDKFFWG